MAWNDYININDDSLQILQMGPNYIDTTWSLTSIPGKMGELEWESTSKEADTYDITMLINSSDVSDYWPIYYMAIDEDGIVRTATSAAYYPASGVNYTCNNTRYGDGPWTFTTGCPPLPVYGYALEIMNRPDMVNDISTNIPIMIWDYDYFSSHTEDVLLKITNYINNGDFTIFDDYSDYYISSVREPIEREEEGSEYTIYNTGQCGTWVRGNIVRDVSTPYYRWARIKLATTGAVDGRLAFWKSGLEEGVIKLKPKNVASVVACEYSTDGGANWIESDSFPFEYIYGERTDELGTFIYATRTGLSGETGVPIFATEQEAEGWVNHDPNVSIDQALNYDDIVGSRYPINNPTGIEEQSTNMGTNSGLASLFTQKILCRKGDVEVIAAGLYDTSQGGIWERISVGLSMMGESPIDAVCGLMYFPVDLSQIFQRVSSQTYIYFGGYRFKPDDEGLSGISVLKITGYDGYLDIGEFNVERAYSNSEDIRNFEPYCNMSIYLPYIGIQKLSYNKYVDKTVKVRYYIDLNTGGCMACLFANGILYDYFNGTMGVQLPITLTDYAGYAASELQNLSNLAGVGVNAGAAVTNAAGGNIMGAVIGVAGTIGGFEKSLYDLSTNSINNFNQTRGGSSSIGNGYLPQYVYCIFEYIQTDETPNLIQLAGKASNASGNLNSFSGYLEVDDITLLTSSGMTEREKQDFINLLHQGIII